MVMWTESCNDLFFSKWSLMAYWLGFDADGNVYKKIGMFRTLDCTVHHVDNFVSNNRLFGAQDPHQIWQWNSHNNLQ